MHLRGGSLVDGCSQWGNLSIENPSRGLVSKWPSSGILAPNLFAIAKYAAEIACKNSESCWAELIWNSFFTYCVDVQPYTDTLLSRAMPRNRISLRHCAALTA
jgi:hypothetical protein